MHLLTGLSVKIDNAGVWFSIKEGFDVGIDFANLFARALDEKSRTFEWISGQAKSHPGKELDETTRCVMERPEAC
jgi:hypothetical protein